MSQEKQSNDFPGERNIETCSAATAINVTDEEKEGKINDRFP